MTKKTTMPEYMARAVRVVAVDEAAVARWIEGVAHYSAAERTRIIMALTRKPSAAGEGGATEGER